MKNPRTVLYQDDTKRFARLYIAVYLSRGESHGISVHFR
jgi:hypothetical protein